MKKLFVLGIAVLFLSGCIGVSPKADFYTLQTVQAKPVTQVSMQVAVEPVKIPAFLDRPQIVTLKENNISLNFSETSRWAESLSDLLQRTLINDLTVLMPQSVIVPKTFSRTDAKVIVFVNVNQFDAVLGQRLTFGARWSLIDQNGNTIYQTQTVISKDITTDYSDLVLKQSEIMGQLSALIAKKIVSVQ